MTKGQKKIWQEVQSRSTIAAELLLDRIQIGMFDQRSDMSYPSTDG